MSGIPDAICWHEGMALLPQHFQLQSLRAEALSARHALGAHPWFWGVERLVIDDTRLGSGLVRVSELRAVMPDGLVVELDRERGKDPLLELQLNDHYRLGHSELMIYLAVAPQWRARQLVPWGERLRSLQSESLPDLESGQFPQPLTVLRPHLRLVTRAGLSDSLYLPLLRLDCKGQSFTCLPYQPPSPRLAPDSPISLEINKLCALARHKIDFLTVRLRRLQDDGKLVESAELRRQLSAIWTCLPGVQAALDSGVVHPADLYLQLMNMAGALVSLDLEQGMPTFAPLAYENLLESFQAVLTWLTAKLSNIRVGYSRRDFTLQDRRFSIELLDFESQKQQLVIGVRMPAGVGPQAALEWLKHAVITSESQVDPLIRQRSQGFEVKALERSEQVAYSVGESFRLFSLRAQGERFKPKERLFLFVPMTQSTLTAPMEIVLFDANTQD